MDKIVFDILCGLVKFVFIKFYIVLYTFFIRILKIRINKFWKDWLVIFFLKNYIKSSFRRIYWNFNGRGNFMVIKNKMLVLIFWEFFV